MCFKTFQEAVNILVDVNDYRQRQKERLYAICDNVVKRVNEEKNVVTLRSFNAYERKIIHEYIGKKYPVIETHSEGEGSERKLLVALREK